MLTILNWLRYLTTVLPLHLNNDLNYFIFIIIIFFIIGLPAFSLCMYVCMYVWLRLVFATARGLSLVAVSGGHSCCGTRALGTRASAVVAHGLSCSAARGILLEQRSNPCPLHWQADSHPLRHQGAP